MNINITAQYKGDLGRMKFVMSPILLAVVWSTEKVIQQIHNTAKRTQTSYNMIISTLIYTPNLR